MALTFDTTFDLVTNQVVISNIASDTIVEVSAFVKLVDEDGDTIYQNPAFNTPTPNYTTPNYTLSPPTNVIPVYLPLDSENKAVNQKYTITLLAIDATNPTPATDTATITVSYNYDTIEPNVEISIDVYTPRATFTDDTTYAYTPQGTNTLVVPTATRAWVLYYPPSSGVPNLTGTSTSLSTGVVWSGTSTIKITSSLSYLMGTTTAGNFYVTTVVTQTREVPIYDNGLCEIYKCVKELFATWNKAVQSASPSLQNTKDLVYQVTAIRQQINEAVKCGNYTDVAALIKQLQDLINCDCGCDNDAPKQLTGISALLSIAQRILSALPSSAVSFQDDLLKGKNYDTTSGLGVADFLVFLDGQELDSTYSTITFDPLAGTINWGVPVPNGTLIKIQILQ
jgi:hypothetical protein